MATVFKLALDKNGNAGLLSIVGEIRRNSHLKQAAEKESANGYIMSNSAPCGGHLRFDITTIIGDIENDSNALFDFVKATVDKPERYAYTQGQLKDYFADADFSVQRIEQLMGKMCIRDRCWTIWASPISMCLSGFGASISVSTRQITRSSTLCPTSCRPTRCV